MIEPEFDSAGDPTEETLIALRSYGNDYADWTKMLWLLEDIWHWGDKVVQNQNKIELHTGGWSGNELIIQYLQETIFWSVCWIRSERGGHYYFKIPGNLFKNMTL